MEPTPEPLVTIGARARRAARSGPPPVLLLNLPHRRRVQRRWVASYEAPNFLIPPLELMGLASVLRQRGIPFLLIDAIAERIGTDAIVDRARALRPAWVVALAGFGTLGDDLDALGRVRDGLPGARSAIFGHLPTVAPQPIARHPGVDVVIRGEPEPTLPELIASGPRVGIPGLAWLGGSDVVRTPDRPRLADLDALPPPDHTVLRRDRYHEPFLPGPIAAVQTARGCPYECSFCVRAYGNQTVLRSPASLAAELSGLRDLGYRQVRFLDDTFTLHRRRAEELCDRIGGLGLGWSCLTRLDRVDAALAERMARAGCRRVYAGIESAEPSRLLDWRKGETIEQIEAGAAAVRQAGIELSGFFLVGAADETEDEVRRSAAFARRLRLDFVVVTRLQRWPGTALGDGPPLPDDAGAWARERLFYRDFYGHPAVLARHARRVLTSPRDGIVAARALGGWLARRASHDLI